MSKMRLFLWLALAGLACGDDIIYLTIGTKVHGVIVDETDEEIVLRTPRGLTTIEKAEIIHIERGGDFEAEFQSRFARLRKYDIDGFMALAAWCQSKELEKDARKCFEYILGLDPENREAREFLGFRKIDGHWLNDREFKLSQGWVEVEGELLPPEVAERRLLGLVLVDGEWVFPEDEGSAAAAQDPAANLPSSAKDLVKIARYGKNAEERREACEQLMGLGEDAVSALVVSLESRQEKARKKLRSAIIRNADGWRANLGQRLVVAREEALKTIFDLSIYPEENHGAVGQPAVDKVVDKVKLIWNDPYLALFDQSEALREIRAELEKATEELARYGNRASELTSIEEGVALEVKEKLRVPDWPVSRSDQQLKEFNRAVLAYNKNISSSITAEERKCIDATNEYRMMMGLKALYIDERLVQAARKHSTDMNTSNFFEHDSPSAGTPAQRITREGATFNGENIAMGVSDGLGVFDQWYNSSGHHRNLLLKTHTTIGVGRDDLYWTQDFGLDTVN